MEKPQHQGQEENVGIAGMINIHNVNTIDISPVYVKEALRGKKKLYFKFLLNRLDPPPLENVQT